MAYRSSEYVNQLLNGELDDPPVGCFELDAFGTGKPTELFREPLAGHPRENHE